MRRCVSRYHRGMNIYPAIFGLNNDFVTADFLDLDLNVSLFFIRDPSSLLTWQRCRERGVLLRGLGELLIIKKQISKNVINI